MEKNKYHYDLTNVYVAELTDDNAETGATFGNPERIPGAVSMDIAPVGETFKMRADASDYVVVESNNGYEGSVTFVQLPDTFREKYLGNKLSTNDKVLTENNQSNGKRFAFLFEFLGDVKHVRHVLYSCLASRPNLKGENKDNQKEPDTEELKLTASPLINGDVKSKTTEETPDEVYTNWFRQVWTKDTIPGG